MFSLWSDNVYLEKFRFLSDNVYIYIVIVFEFYYVLFYFVEVE